MKDSSKLLAIGGLAAIVAIAYFAKKGSFTLAKGSSQSLTQEIYGHPAVPDFNIHTSGQSAGQPPLLTINPVRPTVTTSGAVYKNNRFIGFDFAARKPASILVGPNPIGSKVGSSETGILRASTLDWGTVAPSRYGLPSTGY